MRHESHPCIAALRYNHFAVAAQQKYKNGRNETYNISCGIFLFVLPGCFGAPEAERQHERHHKEE